MQRSHLEACCRGDPGHLHQANQPERGTALQGNLTPRYDGEILEIIHTASPTHPGFAWMEWVEGTRRGRGTGVRMMMQLNAVRGNRVKEATTNKPRRWSVWCARCRVIGPEDRRIRQNRTSRTGRGVREVERAAVTLSSATGPSGSARFGNRDGEKSRAGRPRTRRRKRTGGQEATPDWQRAQVPLHPGRVAQHPRGVTSSQLTHGFLS